MSSLLSTCALSRHSRWSSQVFVPFAAWFMNLSIHQPQMDEMGIFSLTVALAVEQLFLHYALPLLFFLRSIVFDRLLLLRDWNQPRHDCRIAWHAEFHASG